MLRKYLGIQYHGGKLAAPLDLNPIEQVFAKLKALLRKTADATDTDTHLLVILTHASVSFKFCTVQQLFDMLWFRRVIQIGLSAAALFGSFLITLWLTAPDTPSLNSAAEKLAAHHISNDFDSLKAAGEIALPRSQRMIGYIDTINRTSESEVSITGWVADTEGDGTPTKILVFVGGDMVATTETKGERPDLTQALHSGLGSEKNVLFSVKFSCQSGDRFVIVGMSAKEYFPLGPGQCP
jgi:hypothetical protein